MAFYSNRPSGFEGASGGPSVVDALFSAELLAQDFVSTGITFCQESVVELNEGKYHVGPGAVGNALEIIPLKTFLFERLKDPKKIQLFCCFG